MLRNLLVGLLLLATAAQPARKETRPGKPSKQSLSPLDLIIQEAEANPRQAVSTPGSLYDSGGLFGDLARDQRARQAGDLVTIVVYDKASAVSKGTTSTSRKSDASASISALGGPTRVAGPLSSMAGLTGQNSLDGQAETTRENVLQTTISARVTHALPNGNLVVEGTKEIAVNSERQRVRVRGLLRWNDLSPSNRISSDRLAELEVKVDGKGVVNDAIRRPNFLYRLLLGVLPF